MQTIAKSNDEKKYLIILHIQHDSFFFRIDQTFFDEREFSKILAADRRTKGGLAKKSYHNHFFFVIGIVKTSETHTSMHLPF